MKKIISLFFVLALCLGYLWITKAGSGPSHFEGKREISADEPAIQAASPGQGQAVAESALSEGSALPAVESDEVKVVSSAPSRPSLFFPEAKVLSSVVVAGKRPGEKILIKTVQTSMSQPYVRIEETYRGVGQGAELVAQAAMVANQVLVSRPPEMAEAAFMGHLHGAGAIHVKKSGKNYLATFRAAPEDPRALDAFMERLRRQAGESIPIEPNYVRKLYRSLP